MHEMSLAENVLQIIEDAADEQKFTRVKTVWLEIGQLSCVEPDALRFHFEVVTRDSLAHQAQLEIIKIPGQGCCNQCATELPMDSIYDLCPNCGSYEICIIRGDEMRVKELDVE
ncbi:MAG: hydrogenase maturation nickel metallochaperone HypA [Nitrosomonas sp.]|nr:hydrogenase maturation nickel metallochaperone HypA [Nitrosomonas sp.]